MIINVKHEKTSFSLIGISSTQGWRVTKRHWITWKSKTRWKAFRKYEESTWLLFNVRFCLLRNSSITFWPCWRLAFQNFIAWYPLKLIICLNRPAAFNCRFVLVCMTFCWTPGTKRLNQIILSANSMFYKNFKKT